MTFLPVDINFLTDEMVRKAEEELGETPERKKEALAEIRKIIEEQNFTCLTDDKFLLTFLRARKFDVPRAMENIKNFYIALVQNANMLRIPNLEIFEKLFTSKAINVLPFRDKDGCALLLFILKNFDYEEMGMDGFVGMAATTELLITFLYESTQICGVKLILDSSDMGIRHAKYLSPRHIILMAKGMRYLMPIRYKAVYLLNSSVAMNSVWNIVRHAFSAKLNKRFHLLPKEDLTKFLEPGLLPKEYGGTLDHSNNFWINILKNNERRFHEIMKNTVPE